MTAWLETRRVFVVVMTLGLFAMAARNVTDPDVWWHLRTGQLIVQNHQVFHSDPYSFTRLGQPWVNHEWLSDVLMFGLYRVAGWGGLIVGFAVIIAATFLLVYLRSPGRPYVAGLMTVWGAIASVPIWGVRPQMLSLLLASIFLLILERADQRPNVLWWTVPLMLLWVNLHAGYALGVALLLLFLTGGLLDVALGFEPGSTAAPRLRKTGLALIACLAVVPLNPNGLRMYWYPVETLRSRAMQVYIEEWSSPNFHEAKHWAVLLLFLTTVLVLPLSPQRLRPRELVLYSAMAYLALRSVRHVPVFVLVAVPILAALIQAWLEERGWNRQLDAEREHRSSRRMLFGAVVVMAFAAFTLVRARGVVRSQPEAEARKFPAAAVSFIAAQRLPGPILNHYNWGGYLIWRLYPEYRVYVDGRADLYGDNFMDERAALYHLADPRWQAAIAQWGIQTVILPPDAPLAAALRSQPDWRQVFVNSQAVVLTRARNGVTY